MKPAPSAWVAPSIVTDALLHRLQQRRLRLGRRAVDLVGEQQLGEDRALRQRERVGLEVEQVGAEDVARHQVGRELDAPELQRQARSRTRARAASWRCRARPRAGRGPRDSSATSSRSIASSWPTTTRSTCAFARVAVSRIVVRSIRHLLAPAVDGERRRDDASRLVRSRRPRADTSDSRSSNFAATRRPPRPTRATPASPSRERRRGVRRARDVLHRPREGSARARRASTRRAGAGRPCSRPGSASPARSRAPTARARRSGDPAHRAGAPPRRREPIASESGNVNSSRMALSASTSPVERLVDHDRPACPRARGRSIIRAASRALSPRWRPCVETMSGSERTCTIESSSRVTRATSAPAGVRRRLEPGVVGEELGRPRKGRRPLESLPRPGSEVPAAPRHLEALGDDPEDLVGHLGAVEVLLGDPAGMLRIGLDVPFGTHDQDRAGSGQHGAEETDPGGDPVVQVGLGEDEQRRSRARAGPSRDGCARPGSPGARGGARTPGDRRPKD